MTCGDSVNFGTWDDQDVWVTCNLPSGHGGDHMGAIHWPNYPRDLTFDPSTFAGQSPAENGPYTTPSEESP